MLEFCGRKFTCDECPICEGVEHKLKRPLLFSTIKATPKWLRSLETVGLSTESLPFSHKKEGTLKNGYDTG